VPISTILNFFTDLEGDEKESGSDKKKVTELEKECAALREACAKVEHMLQLTRRVNTKKINHLRKYTTWWINQMKTFTMSSGPGSLDLLFLGLLDQNP
jgi:hypothetical protein